MQQNESKLDIVLSLRAKNLSFGSQEQKTGELRYESLYCESLRPEPFSHLLVTGGKLHNKRLYTEE